MHINFITLPVGQSEPQGEHCQCGDADEYIHRLASTDLAPMRRAAMLAASMPGDVSVFSSTVAPPFVSNSLENSVCSPWVNRTIVVSPIVHHNNDVLSRTSM